MSWDISIYRQANDGLSPATAESPRGTRLAVWHEGQGGLYWVDELVKAGKAIDLGGQGYPCRYTATAENIIPRIPQRVDEPPTAQRIWKIFEYDFDRAAATACRPDEWLLVEAWDTS
jgi:hypothetical protein